MASIKWNPRAKLILSDIDETVAGVYEKADKKLIGELSKLLEKGLCIFFVTNGGVKRVRWGITDLISEKLRKNILISHCTGAEVWGFDKKGKISDKPYYSLYEEIMTLDQKNLLRTILKQIIRKFNLKTYNAMPVPQFLKLTKGDPQSIIYDDRGPQITFELINSYDLEPDVAARLEIEIPFTRGSSDLRIPIAEAAEKLLSESKIPVMPRVEAVFALNFALKGISKETSIKYVLKNQDILKSVGLDGVDFNNPEYIEIWGDKFSVVGGPDKHMCEAVNPEVRAIDFRAEKRDELPDGYNIVVWDGKKHLQEGLLEYLVNRHG